MIKLVIENDDRTLRAETIDDDGTVKISLIENNVEGVSMDLSPEDIDTLIEWLQGV